MRFLHITRCITATQWGSITNYQHSSTARLKHNSPIDQYPLRATSIQSYCNIKSSNYLLAIYPYSSKYPPRPSVPKSSLNTICQLNKKIIRGKTYWQIDLWQRWNIIWQIRGKNTYVQANPCEKKVLTEEIYREKSLGTLILLIQNGRSWWPSTQLPSSIHLLTIVLTT